MQIKKIILKFDYSSFYNITIKLVMELFKFLVSISQFLVRLVSFFFPRYISNHLHGLFAGAWDPQTKDPLPVDIPLPNQSQGIDDLKIMNRTCLQIFETKLSLQELWGG